MEIIKKGILFIGLFISVLSVSCNKSGDKKGQDISDQLNSRYCNIPTAVNYNWGFPGIADNSICVFGTDFFVGNWMFVDTVRTSDSMSLVIDTLYWQFSVVSNDSTNSLLDVKGWCNNNETFRIITDKYYSAITDTAFNSLGYQILCNANDTLFGTVKKDVFDTTKLIINLTNYSANGVSYHKGLASKL